MSAIHRVNTEGVLTGLDLNLLVVLDAVLSERNVTAAGRRIGLSQPATSSALRRLRVHFDDPLLVRSAGNQYQLTALGESLAEQLQPLMEATTRLTSSRVSTSVAEREYSIVMVDTDAMVFGPLVVDELKRHAPLATLRIDSATVAIRQNTMQKLRLVDGTIVPHRLLDGAPYVDLYEERWVIVADRDNDRVWDGMPSESFLSVLALVRGTERLALVPSRTAAAMGADIRYVRCPVLPHPFSMAFAWHPMHEREPQHRELRDRLIEAAQRVPPLS
jgi:DNA-binding transcriptional LysR family regulator